MKKTIVTAVAVLAMISLGACATRTVQRVDETQQVDLSGRWNDTDSRLVAEEMISDSLTRVWITDFAEAKGRKPTVIVGLVGNKTHELINTETFTKDLERAFINSGKVKVVQAAGTRDELRGERADQQKYASPETMKNWGREKGADFMLQGTVNSIVDEYKKDKVVYYQVDLELSDLESNEKVWIGDKKIKKLVKN